MNYLNELYRIYPYRISNLILLIGGLLLITAVLLFSQKVKSKKKKKQLKYIGATGIILVFFLTIFGVFLTYKNNLKENNSIQNSENFKIQKEMVFGIDLSHYNGIIHWDKLKKFKPNIEFVVFRSTMGKNSTDKRYKNNLEEARKRNFIIGHYHYYRPNEPSTEQFENFKKHTHYKIGDLPPVLDIEELGRLGVDNLRKGVLNWLTMAEAHYGVKPIIYTGRSFYHQFLRGHVDSEHLLWIAAYSKNPKLENTNWNIHQFSDKLVLPGIKGYVDGNYFCCSLDSLKQLTKQR